MSNIKTLLASAATVLLFTNVCYAAPLNFIETIDFNDVNSSTDFVGNLDIGINTISGSVLRDSSVAGAGDNGDFWLTNLQPGKVITAIDIVITDHVNEQGFFVGAADNNVGGFGPFTAQAYANLIADGAFPLAATVGAYPFADGQYFFGAATNVGTNTGYSYEWRVTVSAVPVPAAVWLFISGLAGLIGLSRSRKNTLANRR